MGGATIYDLARAAGLSPSTVSRALRGYPSVNTATAGRVHELAASLGYRPNAVARSLAVRSSNLLAVVLPDIANPFFPLLVREVQTRARAAGYMVLLCNTGDDPETELQTLEMLARQRIDGVIAIGLTGIGYDLSTFLATPMKFVSLDRSSDGVPWAVVQADHCAGARMATEHLIAFGHRQIACVSGPPRILSAEDRTRGYRQALAASGIVPDQGLIREGDFSEESGYRATDGLLSDGASFSAIFAANDLMALGAISALQAHGMSIPSDVSVVGFDDIYLGRFASPSLTTVHQPLEELAKAAVDQLISSIRGDRMVDSPVMLPVSLVTRESTGPVAVGRSRSNQRPHPRRGNTTDINAAPAKMPGRQSTVRPIR